MKPAIPYLGAIALLLSGWLAGRASLDGPVDRRKTGPPPRTPAGPSAMPRDFARPGANAWLAALDSEQIARFILSVAKEPETRHREQRLAALFGRLFELNGTAAADLWLRIEGDCQPDLRHEMARWAATAPDEAVEWFSRSADQLRRYRSGRLVVDLAKVIIGSITKKNPELGIRLLMENRAFYDKSDDLREEAAEQIRSKGDPDELRDAAKGRAELEILLNSDAVR